MTLGIFGAALFFGDGIIAPAISVLGSIQGVKVGNRRSRTCMAVPLSVAILIGTVDPAAVRVRHDRLDLRAGDALVWFGAIGMLA